MLDSDFFRSPFHSFFSHFFIFHPFWFGERPDLRLNRFLLLEEVSLFVWLWVRWLWQTSLPAMAMVAKRPLMLALRVWLEWVAGSTHSSYGSPSRMDASCCGGYPWENPVVSWGDWWAGRCCLYWPAPAPKFLRTGNLASQSRDGMLTKVGVVPSCNLGSMLIGSPLPLTSLLRFSVESSTRRLQWRLQPNLQSRGTMPHTVELW